MRYNQLLPIIEANKPKTIVEVGTWNGLRAIMMATEALKYQKQVHYIGFDLFEDADDESDKRELNVKKHHSLESVEKTLTGFSEKNPGFTFALIKGDTKKTIPEFVSGLGTANFDLAFIDGGHSIETITSDYESLKDSRVVVMDDYYSHGPDTEKFGCNFIAQDNQEFMILPDADPVQGGGTVQMVLTPVKAWPGKVNLVVKTKNCVPDEEIKSNIEYSMGKITHWIKQCKIHDKLAVFVSGGPSFKEHLEKIRELQKSGAYVVCVKHSHDSLIESGIIPWGCMLLDPRSHVQDFIENPHENVRYLLASMCHPTTLDRLIESNAKITGYHAHVGAGEDGLIKSLGGGIMLGGGSTSAVRGMSVLHCLGFRRFNLYGYDSCYAEKPDLTEKTKMGMQKYFSVNVSGRDFWTDAELIAQAQDFETMMNNQGDIFDLDVIGDGMVPHIFNIKRKILPSFEDCMIG